MKRTSEIYKNFIMMLETESNAHIERVVGIIEELQDKAYKEGFEAGKEYQRQTMQEGKVTYTNITKDQQYCRSPTYRKRVK